MSREPGVSKEPRTFLWAAIVLLGLYLSLRFVAPWVALWAGLSPAPAPIPGFALAIYMVSAVVGTFVYVSSDEERWRAFRTPILHLFVLRRDRNLGKKFAVLAILPLLAGWLGWQQVRPSTNTAAALRVQHPTMPRAYADLENPVRHLSGEDLSDAERDGVVLYQKNCRPCHGAKADGTGPLARGLRLRPVDFSDAGTIATLVESYPFWRIKEGAAGLPHIATPWNSVMPAWKDELSEDDIWKIVMAEYRISGTEPRKPERLEP